MEDARIVQIMPADYWYAVYRPYGAQAHCPLIGWGLYSDGTVCGLYTVDGTINPADNLKGFEEYTRLSR